jgi:hypothetical protein|tara:strand:- start:220 stop:381 length:162 start_codon:yes stop_codon:yes gene_type:complete
MSRRKERTNIKLGILNEINYIDKRMKRFRNNEEETSKLLNKRKVLTNKLKTKK